MVGVGGSAALWRESREIGEDGASRIEPPADTSQATMLMPPYGASAAGSRNTPEPIMLP